MIHVKVECEPLDKRARGKRAREVGVYIELKKQDGQGIALFIRPGEEIISFIEELRSQEYLAEEISLEELIAILRKGKDN